MNLDHMLAQLRGVPPSDLLQPDNLPKDWPTCVQRRCHRPAAIKKNGEPARSCSRCLARRARSCKRRRAVLVAQGGCRRCSYRKRLAGDFLCQRCRDERDRERAQKRQDAIDAAAIDEFAAQPERVHKASNLDRGISPLELDDQGRRLPPHTGRHCRIPNRNREEIWRMGTRTVRRRAAASHRC